MNAIPLSGGSNNNQQSTKKRFPNWTSTNERARQGHADFVIKQNRHFQKKNN